MPYRPPKGVRPPQLEGKRTGRPKGSKNGVHVWRDVLWGYEHRSQHRAHPPNPLALLWWFVGYHWPDELAGFLQWAGKIPRGAHWED